MLTRRSFLTILPFLPAAAKAIVVAASAPAAAVVVPDALSASDYSSQLDALNVATHRRYIRQHPKLVDGIFQHDPLLSYVASTKTFYGGRSIKEPFIYSARAT
jgi:hypothetical protein